MIQPIRSTNLSLADPRRPVPSSQASGFRQSLVTAINTTRTAGATGSPRPAATVVISPFNPLGFPVSTTPAPTAAQVAANPSQYAGTSFDPSRVVTPGILSRVEDPQEATPSGFGTGYGWTPQMYTTWNHANGVDAPPAGSTATNDPNVFVTPAGNTWQRPGTQTNNPTSADYDAWRIRTFNG
jgi:hypothetical protein